MTHGSDPIEARSGRRNVPALIKLLVAWLFLHLLTTTPYPWEVGSLWDSWGRLSPDLLLCLSVGFVSVLAVGPRRWVVWGLTPLVFLVPIYRLGWSVVPAFWGKELDLYNDILMLPGLYHLLTHDRSSVTLALMGAGLVISVLFAFWLIQLALRVVLRGSGRRGAVATLLLFQLVMIASWVEAGPDRAEHRRILSQGMYEEAMAEVGEIVRSGLWRYRQVWKDRTMQAMAAVSATPANVRGLESVDVHVLILESYGRAAFIGGDLEWMRPAEEELRRGGLTAASGFARPSILGGGSKLAHAEFLSGVQVGTERIFELMIQGWLKPLPKFFREAGYETVTVQPMMPRSWPEGAAYYGFDREVFRKQLPYSGHSYPWGVMPDQFALARVLKDVVEPASRPVFVQFVSISSHAPFAQVPPYLDDWAAAAGSDAWQGGPQRTFDINWANYRDHAELREAYESCVGYALTTGIGYARNLPRPSLVIIIGDHQPPGFGDRGERQGALRDVPIHFVTNRPEILLPLRNWGLKLGLRPDEEATVLPFHRFLARFLAAYGK